MTAAQDAIRRERRRSAIDEDVRSIQEAVSVVAGCVKRRQNVEFERQELQQSNRGFAPSDQVQRALGWTVIGWLLAVYLIDVTILRPSLEFIAAYSGMSEGAARTLVIYLMPAGVVALDVAIGGQFSRRSPGFFSLWLWLAIGWSLMMPLMAAAAYIAETGTLANIAFKLQLAGLCVLAFCSHGSLVFTGEGVHRAIALRLFHFRWKRLSRAAEASEAAYLRALNEAKIVYDACMRDVRDFNRDYPEFLMQEPMLPRGVEVALGAAVAHDEPLTPKPAIG